MDKELQKIEAEISEEQTAFWKDRMTREPNLRLSLGQMTESFILKKLAEHELRLRQLESINKPIK